jgi:subtilisin family serine protease
MAAASAGAAERTAVNLERFAANLSEPVVVAGAGDRHLYPNNNANVEIAVTLSGPPVAEGSNKATVMAEQAAFIARVASMAPAARVIGSVQLVANTVFLAMPASDLPALGADRAVTRMTGAGNYEYHLEETVPYIGAETVQGRGFTGKGVRVAVLDSGIDYTHTAFGGEGTPAAYAAAWGTAPADPRNTTLDGLFPTSKVIGGFDFIGERWTGAANSPPLAPDPDPIGAPDATTPGGHGTHVADIIGGKKGVAPDVQFYAVKVCAAISASCSGIALLQGMDFAVDPNGDGDTSDHVDIINMSLGSDYGQPFDDDLSAAVDRTTKLGVLTVASAGNGSNKPAVHRRLPGRGHHGAVGSSDRGAIPGSGSHVDPQPGCSQARSWRRVPNLVGAADCRDHRAGNVQPGQCAGMYTAPGRLVDWQDRAGGPWHVPLRGQGP